ncbi:MAG: substrate-binding domain-containing protein [Lachnospiraceae bacterium]
MKKQLLLVLCIIMMTSALLFGCTNASSKADTSDNTAEAEISIGFSFDSFVIERWIRDRNIFVSTAQEYGAEVNVQVANGDAQEQISQIEYLIRKKMDVIAIVAIDADALSDVVQKAREEGIKVICYDRLIKNADADLYISFDNVQVGELMAQALIDSTPDGSDIFMIQGPVSDNNVALVYEGFTQTMAQTNRQIVYSANCSDWLAEDAFSYVTEGLTQYPDVAGVMCGNDDLASQAFRALSVKQKAGKIALVGQDGDLSACQRIVEGTQTMTVYKSVETLAKTAARYAIKLAKDEPLNLPDTMNDGTYDVPLYLLSPIAVTKENMDDIILEENFHIREDVYLNIQQ